MNSQARTSLPSTATQIFPLSRGFLHRSCTCRSHTIGGECEECKGKKNSLQRQHENNNSSSEIPPIVHEVLNSPGQSLDTQALAFLESRFKQDFSNVQVHTDQKSSESARAVNAHAFTVGDHMVFGFNQYQPNTPKGAKLLVHELTHVAQQRLAGGTETQYERAISHPLDVAETEAEKTAEQVMSGGQAEVKQRPSAILQGEIFTGAAIGIGVGVAALVAGGIAYLAGAFDSEIFSDSDLQAYLKLLAQNRNIENSRSSDNKARDIVRRWQQGLVAYNLDAGYRTSEATISSVELKRLLIQEMLSGLTGDADERAIIAIFKKTADAKQIEELLAPAQGLSIQDLENKIGGDNQKELLQLLNEKLPTLGEPYVKRSETPGSKSGACTVSRGIKIHFAQQRAEILVNKTISLLDQYFDKPVENKNVERLLQCYFKGANQSQLHQIREAFQLIRSALPRLKYFCPAEPFEGFKLLNPKGEVVQTFEPERDLLALAFVEQEQVNRTTPEKTQAENTKNLNIGLAPGFFEWDPEEQARVFIHEAFHHAKHQGEANEVYQPKCGELSLATALENADSYAQFAMMLKQEGLQLSFETCSQPWKQEILAATQKAEQWVNNAVSRVDTVLVDPKYANSRVSYQLRRHFKIEPTDKDLTKVRASLGEMQSAFGSKMPFVCETECDKDVAGEAPGALLGLIHRAGSIHLCPHWFINLDHLERSETILHEMAHRYAAKDEKFYYKAQFNEYLKIMSKEDALDNADSYAQFSRYLEGSLSVDEQ